MSKRTRRYFSPEQKAGAVIRHLQDGVPVSDICDELDIHPNKFYEWKKQALSNMAEGLRSKREKGEYRQKRQIEKLQSEISNKDGVIAELLSEHMALKKKNGDV